MTNPIDDQAFIRAATIVSSVPLFSNERDRRALVLASGVEHLLPVLDLSGPPLSAALGLLDILRGQGRLPDGRFALAAFLTAVSDIVQGEPGRDLAAIVAAMGEPVPVESPAVQPRLVQADEKIIGDNTLRPFEFLRAGVAAGACVARLTVRSSQRSYFGTSFRVADGLLVTNHHVLPDKESCSAAIAEFHHEAGVHRQSLTPRACRLDASRFFATDPHADLTVVALVDDDAPEAAVRFAKLPPAIGDRVNIIQHPQGGYKQVSLQDNRVTYRDDLRIQYRTATLPGSSGSPVFNDDWELVAVHSRGGNLRRGTEQDIVFTNEGALCPALEKLLP